MNNRMLVLALLALAGGPMTATRADDVPPVVPVTPAVPPVSHDPEAVDYLKTLEGVIQKQTDAEALSSIKQLVAFWKDPGVKIETKKPIPGLVAWYARRKVSAVALAGVAGLADIGKGEGAKNLLAVLETVLVKDDSKPTEIDALVTDAVFAALKAVADPDTAVTTPIVKLFLHPNDAVVAKAADVFGGYDKAPPEVRRDLFEEMLRNFEGVASSANSAAKGVNKSALNKWVAVGVAVMGSMDALAHQKFAAPAAARAWFNEHKKDIDAWR